jgi:hypothetical protein
VHDGAVTEVASASLFRAGTYWASKKVADLETSSPFYSTTRNERSDIPHTRNNWICCAFGNRRIVPIHNAMRSCGDLVSWPYLKSWMADGT